jgi:hypothetical protein
LADANPTNREADREIIRDLKEQFALLDHRAANVHAEMAN